MIFVRRICVIALTLLASAASHAPAQVVNVLHSFVGGATDGDDPQGSLIQSNGVFYGMSPAGGTANLVLLR